MEVTRRQNAPKRAYSSHSLLMIMVLALSMAGCGRKADDLNLGYGVGDRVIGPEISDVRLGIGKDDIARPQEEFAASDTVLLSFSVDKVASFRVGKEKYIWIRQDLQLLGRDGAILAIQPSITAEKSTVQKKAERLLNKIELSTIKSISPGHYTAVINITDLVSFQSTAKRIPFGVR